MRTRTVFVGVGCLVLGLLAGALVPPLRAQATTACVSTWEVKLGSEEPGGYSSHRAGWHAVKWNTCTGEAFVFSARDHEKLSPADATFIPVQ